MSSVTCFVDDDGAYLYGSFKESFNFNHKHVQKYYWPYFLFLNEDRCMALFDPFINFNLYYAFAQNECINNAHKRCRPHQEQASLEGPV